MSPSQSVKEATALIGGLVWGPVGVLLIGIAVGSQSWLLRAALIPVGAILIIRFVPPAFRIRLKEMRENDPLNAYVDPPIRVRCPCCRQPTLEPETRDQSCVLCEWHSEGLPDGADTAGPEALREARDRFREFLSVYPPDNRPSWTPQPPSPDELELRRALLLQYSAIRSASKAELWNVWESARQLEHELRTIEDQRAERQ